MGGPPQPYGFGPRSAKKSKVGLVAALVGGGVLVVVLLVVGVVALGGADEPKRTSGKAAAEAGQALGQAAGLTLTGVYAGGRADFSVTKAGSARGTYTVNGSQVGRIDIDRTTYLKAGTDFWTGEGLPSDRADKADGRWTKAPSDAVSLNLSDLSPTRLAPILRQAGNDPLAVWAPVNGVQTIKMRAGAWTYYISKSEPRRLVRVEGGSDTDRYAFDVTALTPVTVGPVFTALRGDVHALVDAYDPYVSLLPVSKMKFDGCGESGCSVSVGVRPTAVGDSPGTVRITMKVTFREGSHTVSTCTDSASATADHRVTLSCRTSGEVWSSWYRSHTSGFSIGARPAFETTVNSSADVSGLMGRLAREQRTG